MKLTDFSKFLQENRGDHTTSIYMPSIKRDLSFKPLTTADVKTLSRIGIFNDFDINNELLKLSLFDKLVVESPESCGLSAENITQMDFFSFLIGIRRLLNNELSFMFTCQECEKQFKHTIDLEKDFSDFIFNYERKQLTFEKMDNSDKIWRFELESYTMKMYLYYRYYIERLKEVDVSSPDLLNEARFIRPVLYIKNIYVNNEPVEDWGEQALATKVKIFNSFPSELIIDSTGKNIENVLSKFIQENFDEEKILKYIENMEVKCTNPECGEVYTGLYSFDDFFTF